jgi:phospholipid:diacylglycerol acyltransferase
MSFIRRRFGGNDASSSEPSREPTPEPGRPSNLRVVTAEKLQTLKTKKSGKKKNFWIFVLGGMAGVVAAAFFAGSNDMIDFSSLEGVNLDSLYEALPAGFLKDAQQMQVGAGTSKTRHLHSRRGVLISITR